MPHASAAEAMIALAEPRCSDPTEWVEAHGDYLYNYAFGQVRQHGDAEDLVQETFLAALKARDRFNRQASERTWLVSILRHKICDHFRRKCRERLPADDGVNNQQRFDRSLLWIHETAAECISPSRRIDLNDFRASLESALQQLPPRIAQAFSMYEMDECASANICSQMNISEQNLWTMVHRARKRLRELLPNWRSEINHPSDSC
jgi:RNA polymerase sigma-70 factor (TIGR02943 family)